MIKTLNNRSLNRVCDHHSYEGTTTLENGVGSQLTVTRSLDDIYSESVTVRSSQGAAVIQDFDIQASDGVIFSIDTVI